MKEYIERDKVRDILLEEIDSWGSCHEEKEALRNVIPRLYDDISAADVVERKRGEWEDEYGGAFANPRYRCSVCKEKALYRHEQDCLGGWHEEQALTDFCPHCNADMRSHQNILCDQTEEGEHD